MLVHLSAGIAFKKGRRKEGVVSKNLSLEFVKYNKVMKISARIKLKNYKIHVACMSKFNRPHRRLRLRLRTLQFAVPVLNCCAGVVV